MQCGGRAQRDSLAGYWRRLPLAAHSKPSPTLHLSLALARSVAIHSFYAAVFSFDIL
jgi:hypothetical protein